MHDDLTPDTKDALIRVAHDLADAARPETLRHFRTGLSSDNKADGGRFDPVTEADRAADGDLDRSYGSDGISVVLVILTTLLSVVAIRYSWEPVRINSDERGRKLADVPTVSTSPTDTA